MDAEVESADPQDCVPPAFLAGGGEMGTLIRAHDWARTPIGAPQVWSRSLRTMAGFLLASRSPLLLWWGPQCICLYNDACRPVLGSRHPEALGQACSEKPLIDTPFSDGASAWMAGGELEVLEPDSSEETHFTIAYSPVPDDAAPRGIGGVLATVHDIAETVIGRRRASALSESERQRALKAADRQKDEFLAMLAHELRNPLAPLRSSNELLSKLLGSSDPTVAGAVDIARRQVDQLTHLVEELLDVSRVTSGHLELQRRPTSVPQIVAQALEAVQPLMREKRHRISVRASGVAAPFVNADPARLTQCLVNALTNATKYTDAGGTIELRVRTARGNAIIEVVDSGVGIAPELLPRIFDLFVQGERPLDRTQGGLGLGLAVVKRLVEMHDGEVRVQSAGPGRGTSLEMRFPLVEAPQSSEAAGAATAIPAARVLVVDDNEDSADSLATLLKLEGHEVRAVYSATSALEHALSFKPEVLLIDVGLPQMDGYEVARRLRQLPALKGSTLIAVTGYGMPDDRARATAAGFDEHLVKPVRLASLLRAMAGLRNVPADRARSAHGATQA